MMLCVSVSHSCRVLSVPMDLRCRLVGVVLLCVAHAIVFAKEGLHGLNQSILSSTLASTAAAPSPKGSRFYYSVSMVDDMASIIQYFPDGSYSSFIASVALPAGKNSIIRAANGDLCPFTEKPREAVIFTGCNAPSRADGKDIVGKGASTEAINMLNVHETSACVYEMDIADPIFCSS